VGSSIADSVYYFWTHFGDNSSGMYGLNQFAGAPGRGMLPIDPHQLLSVLCVTELPVDFTQAPTVLLTMDTTPCNYAYVLTYIDHQPVTNRLFARREIYLRWSDKEEPRPFMIKYFDGQGRRIMIAKLGSYRPIKMLDAGDEQSAAPEMPSEIDIVWPQTNSRIHLSLSEMSTKDVDPELFLFWDRLPDGMRGVIRSVDDVDGPAPTDATTVPASAPAAANGRDAKEAM
jgi:hypothetical protein